MKRIVQSPRAQDDILETVAFLVDASARAGERFLDDVDAAFLRIARFPQAGPIQEWTRRENVRGLRVREWLVLYVEHDTHIEVLRVVSGHSDRRTVTL